MHLKTVAAIALSSFWAAAALPPATGEAFVANAYASQSDQDHGRDGGDQGNGGSQQDDNNGDAVNCNLTVPANPLSAQGLATPYLLSNQDGDDDGGPCHERNRNAAAFVQAAVFDPASGHVSVYNPLVIDRDSDPAIPPTVPALPKNPVVGIWIGFNGNTLRLRGPGRASCVEGVEDSVFKQNAFCNATAFFQAANAAIQSRKLSPPPLGTAADGKTCPSSRDFSLVDQDQSDNTTTTYLVTHEGRVAQDTPQNRNRLPDARITFNGSDEGVVENQLDPALRCTPWMAPDLTDPTHTQKATAWPLSELQAAKQQAQPVALIPALDPFTLVRNRPNLDKLNAYRAGVDQPAVASLADADTRPYCQNLLTVGLPRIAADRPLTAAAPSPFPMMADNLFDFLAMRFHNTFSDQPGFLFCQRLLGVRNPVKLHMRDDVVVGADIDLNPRPMDRDDGGDDGTADSHGDKS
jgi:hypothetical protein